MRAPSLGNTSGIKTVFRFNENIVVSEVLNEEASVNDATYHNMMSFFY